MSWFEVGDEVRVAMPRAKNKRGVTGIHVMYTTSPEAKFDGAVGTVTEIDPTGTHGIPLYLVDFTGHENRAGVPWTKQWFRQEWIQHVEEPARGGKKMIRPVETS